MQTLKAKRTWISFFAICEKLKQWKFYFLQTVKKLKKQAFYVLQTSKSQKKTKIYYLQTLKIELKKMDFNFANCVKLAKRILFLGNFEKLKKNKKLIFYGL